MQHWNKDPWERGKGGGCHDTMQRRSKKPPPSAFDGGSPSGGRRRSSRAGGSRTTNGRNGSAPSSLLGVLMIFGAGTVYTLLYSAISRMQQGPLHPAAGGLGGPGGVALRGGGASVAAGGPRAGGTAAARRAAATPGDDAGTTSPTTNATLHIIFSTDCGTFQHWQSYLFFHAALKVRQPGYVTRIASGCTDDQLKAEQKWHDDHIRNVMSDRFRIHFTPHFSGVKDEATGEVKGDYKFFNKPFGLKHFLEHGELTGLTDPGKADAADPADRGTMSRPDDVIVLCDPDMLLLRPIIDDFSDTRSTLVGPRRKQIYKEQESHIVRAGHPYAQTYGLGTQWRKFDLVDIAGKDSPALQVDQPTGAMYYPVGPPYLAVASDMHAIAVTWSDFAPRVHRQYPHLLAEMYAYCIAAAHLGLPHMMIDSLMVSSAGVGGEGWPLVNSIPSEEVCTFAQHPDNERYPVPSVMHYCQRYAVDRYFWGKRKTPHDIFTCDHPLLVDVPSDLGSGNYLKVYPNGKPKAKPREISATREKQDAFMLCGLTAATNDAMVHFKDRHCADAGGGERGRTYSMWSGKATQPEEKP